MSYPITKKYKPPIDITIRGVSGIERDLSNVSEIRITREVEGGFSISVDHKDADTPILFLDIIDAEELKRILELSKPLVK